MTMLAIRPNETGGPEILKVDSFETPVPGPGQTLVRVEAAGVNFIDVYFRTGQYKAPLPLLLGREGAGVVVSVGQDVKEPPVGARVAWAMVSGAYADHCIVPADQLVVLPDGVETRLGAAVMLQGMTAHYLTHATYPLDDKKTCLVHAAAGGVGLLLCQIAKRRGARVIGTTSTEAKAKLAREAGADHVILYGREDFQAVAKGLTQGRGVDVVYDSVGKTTFDKSLGSLAPRGMLVLYGQSSGAVPPFDPQILAAGASLFFTRPSLADYVKGRAELLLRANDVLSWVADGSLKVRIGATFPLAEASLAHRALEGRETTGKVLLTP
jgi:NADPH:quinone reductase